MLFGVVSTHGNGVKVDNLRRKTADLATLPKTKLKQMGVHEAFSG